MDQTFVIGMDTDPAATAIVSSTIALAHRLGMRVVAEAVENERTMQLLGEMGCDVAQGFHLGRPMPESQLLRWLDEWQQQRGDGSVVPLHPRSQVRRRRSGA